MNLANSTSMEFTTPYISNHLYVNLATGQGTFGKVNIQVMSPLSIGGGVETPVTWTVWLSLEDVELRFPTNATPATTFAQVGGEVTKMRNTGVISGAIGSVGSVVSKTLPALGLGALSQPVEALASGASGLARFFGFSKPSDMQAPTVTVPRPFRGQLNVDGPDHGDKLGGSVATELQTLSGFAGTDEDEMSLSYIASRPCIIDTWTWPTANAGGAQDTRLATYRVTPASLIWNANNVTPTLPRIKNAETRMSHAAFVADKYQMWRGDIVYTFHFAKTQLHSGRLRFNFKAFTGDIFTADPMDQADLNSMPGFTMTEDVDLATTAEFRFRVPYVSSRPWMLTQWPQFNAPAAVGDLPAFVDAKNFCLGELEVVVLNQLTAMSTVSPTVKVVVFGHMENAAFAVPRRSSTLPNYLTSPAARLAAEEVAKVEVRTAHNLSVEEWKSTRRLGEAQIGGEVSAKVTETQRASETDVLPAAACQGEVHTSFRQVLKRYNLIGYVKNDFEASQAGKPGSSGNWFVIRPWAAALNGVATATSPDEWGLSSSTATNISRATNDLYSALYGNYAFFRGGMRFRMVFDNLTAQGELASVAFSVYLVYPQERNPVTELYNPRSDEFPYTVTSTSDGVAFRPHPAISGVYDRGALPNTDTPPKTFGGYDREGGWEALQFINIQGGIEFEVPYYSTGHMSTCLYPFYSLDTTTWKAQRNGQWPLPLVLVGCNYLYGADAPPVSMRVYRAVADDFSFAGLLGVPRSTLALESAPIVADQNVYGPTSAYAV